MSYTVKTGIEVDFNVNISQIERVQKMFSSMEKKSSILKKPIDLKVKSNTKKVNSEMNALLASIDKNIAKMEKFGRTTRSSSDKARKSLIGVKSILVSIGSVLSGKEALSFADSSTSIDNRIRLITDNEKELVKTRAALLDISNKTRSDLKDTVPLYYALTKSSESLGLSEQRRLKIVETINKLNVIGGTSTQAISAAMVQFGQGLSLGKFHAEELNSVMEQTPRLAQAIADGMGVPIGKLKKLSSAGLITSERAIKAIESQAEKASQEMSKIGITASSSMNLLKNSAREAIGDIDNATGATAYLSEKISDLSKYILDNKTEITSFFKDMKNNISELIPYIKTAGELFIGWKLVKFSKNIFDMGVEISSLSKKLWSLKGFTLDWKKMLGVGALPLAIASIYGSFADIGSNNISTTRSVAGATSLSMSKLLNTKKELEDRISDAVNPSILDKVLSDDYRRIGNLGTQLNRILKQIDTLKSKSINIDIKSSGSSSISSFLNKLGEVESRGNYYASQKNGSYKGKYQFNEKSANEFLNKIGKSWDEYLHDPSVQDKVVKLEIERNAKILSASKIPITELTSWVAHNLGATGATRILSGKATRNDMYRLRNQAGMSANSTVNDYLKKYSKIFSNKILELNTVVKVKDNVIKADKEIQDFLSGKKILTAKQLAKIEEKEKIKRIKLEKEHQRIVDKNIQKRIKAERRLGIAEIEYVRKTGTEREIALKKLSYNIEKLKRDGLESSKISEYYKEEMNKIDIATGNVTQKIKAYFSDAFSSKNISGTISDIGGIASSLAHNGVSNTAQSLVQTGVNSLKSSNDPASKAIGYTVDVLSGLLSSRVSDKEISDAKGKSYFDSASISEFKSIFESSLMPGVTLAREQLQELKNLEVSFNNISNYLSDAKVNGVSIDGRGFVGQSHTDAIGFSAYSEDLIGAGLKFADTTLKGFMDGINVVSYQSIKETSSKFWGLITSESIKEINSDVPQKIKDDISNIVEGKIQSSIDSLSQLGFDTTKFEEALQREVFSLGKIDFSGLSSSEKNEALNGAIGSGVNSSVTGALSSTNNYLYEQINSFRTAGEEFTSTLARVAVDMQTASVQLGNFGQQIDILAQSEALIRAAGGLQQFNAGMSVFRQGFFTPEEQREMNRLNLQTALVKHNVLLPATKEEFKALVLTTQQKVLTLSKNIEIRKAELRAEILGTKLETELKKAGLETSIGVAKSEIKVKTETASMYQQVVAGRLHADNALINSTNKAGEATVGFGRNIHTSVQAMVSGVGDAIKTSLSNENIGEIDYAAIGDSYLSSMESELASAEALYGTLMGNMDSFSSLYNDSIESSVESISNIGSKSLPELSNSSYNAQSSISGLNTSLDETASKERQREEDIKNANEKIISFNSSIKMSAINLDVVGLKLSSSSMHIDLASDKVSKSIKDLVSAFDTLSESTSKVVGYTKQMQILQMQDGAGGSSALNSAITKYRETFLSEKDNLLIEKTLLAKKFYDVGVNSMPTTKDELKHIIDTYRRGTPEADFKFGKLLTLTGEFVSLQEATKNLTKGFDDLHNYSLKTLMDFGDKTIESLNSSLKSALEDGNYDGAKSSFNNIVEKVKNSNMSEYDRAMEIAKANNLIENNSPDKNYDIEGEIKKVNSNLERILKVQEDISINTKKTYMSNEDVYINGERV